MVTLALIIICDPSRNNSHVWGRIWLAGWNRTGLYFQRLAGQPRGRTVVIERVNGNGWVIDRPVPQASGRDNRNPNGAFRSQRNAQPFPHLGATNPEGSIDDGRHRKLDLPERQNGFQVSEPIMLASPPKHIAHHIVDRIGRIMERNRGLRTGVL